MGRNSNAGGGLGSNAPSYGQNRGAGQGLGQAGGGMPSRNVNNTAGMQNQMNQANQIRQQPVQGMAGHMGNMGGPMAAQVNKPNPMANMGGPMAAQVNKPNPMAGGGIANQGQQAAQQMQSTQPIDISKLGAEGKAKMNKAVAKNMWEQAFQRSGQ